MPAERLARPGRRPPGPGGWLLLAALGLLMLSGATLLRAGLGTRANLERMVVTAAPSPAGQAPLLLLPTLGPPAAGPVAPATILLLGSDRRPGEQAIPRTDAIILVRVDPGAGRVALLSLPRDLWVAIPGHGSNRLNAAYLWGERDGPPGAGLALARASVSDLLGIPVDYVAVADFRGFAALIDTLGGVTIDVPEPLVDERFPTHDRGYTRVAFAAGPQRMDGRAALTYARLRHPDSDFARGQRQQQILLAIAAELRRRGELANLADAERLSAALAGLVQTDMPAERILELAWAMRELDPAAIERYALGKTDVGFGVASDRFALTASPERLARLADQLLGRAPYSGEQNP